MTDRDAADDRGLDAPRIDVVLLDRDGVVNEERDDFVRRPEDWVPLPGALEAIARLVASGRRVAIVSNQSGLARGIIEPSDLAAIHDAMRSALARHGARVEGFYVCPHAPDDGCACRKPAPGLLRRAMDELGVPPERVAMVGDRPSDLDAARNAGCRSWLVRSGRGEQAVDGARRAGVPIARDLAGVVDAILGDAVG